MINDKFRPWGTIPWLMPRLKKTSWQVIGAVSAEDRCVASLQYDQRIFHFDRADFLCIADQESIFSAACTSKRNKNLEIFERLTTLRGHVYEAKLLQSAKTLQTMISEILHSASENVVLDISTLPKRFFFPMTRWILQQDHVKNLVVTYTRPETYTSEQLAYDPESWAHLPTFQSQATDSTTKVDCVVVGVGFVPFGLPELLRHDYAGARAMLLLPFPPGPPQAQRTWQFVNDIEGECRLGEDRQIVRVHAFDVAGCFDQIDTITERGAKRTIFAPYGPKPHSLAMCLYALARDLDVFYTQPMFYHPDYSSGIKRTDEGPDGYAYALKINGRNLYS